MRAYKTTGYKRRQYEDIARILGETLRDTPERTGESAKVWRVVTDFVTLFTNDNPRFDAQRFNAAVADYAEGRR